VRIAVLSTVIFDVPDDGRTLDEIRDRFYAAHVLQIGKALETATGQPYILRTIEKLELVPVAAREET
jgi:hypothetical protein